MRYRVGIDIGGTFSDLVVLAADGRVETLKVSSAPERLIPVLLDGLRTLLNRAGLVAGEAEAVVHGTTVATNACIGPVVERYVGALQAGLQDAGIAAPLLMMQSTGGVMHAESARRRPIEVVESGPAAGVVAALELARQLGKLGQNIITVDMGGTTAKASILEDGRAFQMTEYEVGAGITSGSRLFKGGGHLLRDGSILFSFDGMDEMDEVHGAGTGTLQDDHLVFTL